MALSAEEVLVLQTRLAAYYAAELAVLRNQSYEMPDGRKLTRTSLTEIRKAITDLRNEIANAAGAPIVKGRARRFVNMSR